MKTNNPATRLVNVLFAAIFVSAVRASAAVPPPANAPAEATWSAAKGVLQLRYHDSVILDAKLQIQDAAGARDAVAGEVMMTPDVRGGGRVEQRLHFALARPKSGTGLLLKGTVTASQEAFPAETPGEAQSNFPMIRTSDGLSRNLRNNAIYDRRWDWELAGPTGGTRIEPQPAGAQANVFAWESRGAEIELVFRPLFYQKHKNLPYFEPWNYPIRKDSITGWCSWWAYKAAFTETDLANVVRVLAEKHLRDFGYRWIQIDDGYQRGPGIGTGTPESWLVWNKLFPGGIDGYVKTVRSAGFDPGVWMQVYFKDEKIVAGHPDWFVHSNNAAPFKAKWVFYGIDATVDQAADTLVRPTFHAYHEQGFSYVKIDTLRHLLYDSIHNAPDCATNRGFSGDDIFRRYLSTARQELGWDTFVLGCWGVLPEEIGLVDGCRLGGDGFGPATLQQYNSWSGVVWRNDPDHCDIRPATRAAAETGNVTQTTNVNSVAADAIIRPTLASLAGAMLMLSDKAEVYQDDANLEGVKRAAPVLFTVPGQLYDFDPSKSDNLITLDRSKIRAGSRPTPVDANQKGDVCQWWMVEIDRPFEHWSILARMNWTSETLPAQTVKFADLGLPADGENLVYEFWSKKYLGAVKGRFESPALEPKGVQIYAIRQKLDHPQIVSTSRHISQGGVDLQQVEWQPQARTLAGRSSVVQGDNYELAVRVPAPMTLASATIDSKPAKTVVDGELVRISCLPAATGEVNWTLVFKP